MKRALSTILAGMCFACVSCSTDAADQEYLAALRGEETGMGRPTQLRHVERAIALAPGRAWYRETHAIYSIDVRAYEAASADLDTAIQLADRPYLRFLRGLVACERGNYEQSLGDFDLAIAQQPKNIQFFRGRSLARSAVGRYADAYDDAQKIMTVAPQQAESHNALGVALTGLGRHREAIGEFNEAMRQRPELIYPLRGRADAYQGLGDTLRATADRKEAERRERDDSHDAAAVDPFRY